MPVIETGIDDRRRFSNWRLAYSGPEDFIDHRLGDLLTMYNDQDISIIGSRQMSSLAVT